MAYQVYKVTKSGKITGDTYVNPVDAMTRYCELAQNKNLKEVVLREENSLVLSSYDDRQTYAVISLTHCQPRERHKIDIIAYYNLDEVIDYINGDHIAAPTDYLVFDIKSSTIVKGIRRK